MIRTNATFLFNNDHVRVIAFTGGSSTGKTHHAQLVMEDCRQRHGDLRDKNYYLTLDCTKLNRDASMTHIERLSIDAMRSDSIVLVLDEAHHLGTQCDLWLQFLDKARGYKFRAMVKVMVCSSAWHLLSEAFQKRCCEIRFEDYIDEEVVGIMSELVTGPIGPEGKRLICALHKSQGYNIRATIDRCNRDVVCSEPQSAKELQNMERRESVTLGHDIDVRFIKMLQQGDISDFWMERFYGVEMFILRKKIGNIRHYLIHNMDTYTWLNNEYARGALTMRIELVHDARQVFLLLMAAVEYQNIQQQASS